MSAMKEIKIPLNNGYNLVAIAGMDLGEISIQINGSESKHELVNIKSINDGRECFVCVRMNDEAEEHYQIALQ